MAQGAQRDAAARGRADAGVDDPAGYENAYADAAPPARRPRAGAGGRWLVWVGRVLLWAFLIVVAVNGVWYPLRGGLAGPAESSAPELPPAAEFPETAASALALRFADAYLNAADPETRLSDLAAFVPEGAAAGLSVPEGAVSGDNLAVVAVEVQDDHNAIVTVRADVNGHPMSLDVPVYTDGSALVVSGQPALLAVPDRAALPERAAADTDSEAAAALEEVLSGFFEAYAQEPGHLSRYVEPGGSVAELPEDALEFAGLSDITVPARAAAGEDDVRRVAATVRWRLPAADEDGADADLVQSYQVTVVNSDGEWYVRDIQGAPHSFGG